MAKRSKRRQKQQNKDQAGCMWGLISMFDFRHGQTTRRLLSDRSIVTEDIIASEVCRLMSSEERHVNVAEKNEKPTLETVKTSVKELLEEEMVSEQDSTKETDGDEVENISKKSFGDLEALTKEILLIYQRKNTEEDPDEGQNRNFTVVEDKLSAAVEVFMNEKSSDESQLIDMFQMLNSNKELFLKLVQDQASLTTNEDQKSKSTEKSNRSETEPKQDIPLSRKNRNFFFRRSKSQESMPIDRIVILKPNSLQNKFKDENEVHREKLSTQFSFMEIKKRLKNVIGKEKSVGEGSNGWRSPNRKHFYTERFTKRIENDENNSSSRDISNIYVEARKHLSEILSGGDEDADLIIGNVPKSLGNILEENGYDSVNESQPCTVSVDLEEKPIAIDEVDLDTSPEGVLEIENRDEIAVLDEPCSPSETMDEIVDLSDEENEFSSPTGYSHSHKIDDPEIGSSDKTGRPSPVSVLEPLFSDNEISPASNVSRPIEYTIQPRCIRFEDQEIRTRNCVENEESAFEYVEAVLLASDLDWDEFGKRWVSSMQILDSSLFDEVQIFSSCPSHDQRLMFDATNEVLEEVCDCYLGFFLELSFIRRKIQPVPKGADLINEVWERIELHLKDNYPLSLDELVMKDLGISRTWMDLSYDSREIVYDIDELIFEDMIDDILLSLVNDRVDNET